ncbi:hypothetical protein MLD38_020425 [Melastoma candidum]|uniref:Uncharacterized protein n=1 Tax=Melastoma candidum TaxID=119954 RepID=A0ACB9QD15_9MYRT|nr:hypothetical protein MLD38_020425 [Melastoma candidum]
MSRCFPFPPPGYVKKARADDADLLKKEKEKEKKHKKERRDKEKRDGKERKEKDRIEGKHRDKKEKKDRHKDKRKDRDKEKEKEREREKDRGGTSEERRLSEQQTDGRNSKERIIHKDRPPEQIPGTSGQMDKEKNRTHLPDVRRVDGLSAGHSSGSAPKSLGKNQNVRKNQNNHAVHNSMEAKFVLELGKRVRDEAGVTTQSSGKITVIDRRKDDNTVQLINATSGPSPDKKERSHDRRVDDRRLSGLGGKEERKIVTSQNSSSVLIPVSEGMPRPPKTSIEEKMAGREKIRDKERELVGADELILLDSQKSKITVKDKKREREKRKGERTKMVENRVYEEEKLRERTEDSLDAAAVNDIVLHVHEEVNKMDPSVGNDKKRKNLEPNGFLHENETRQIKLPRPSCLSHASSVENGRIEDTPRSANQLLLGKHGKPDVVNADKPKEHKPNGTIEKKTEHLLSPLDAASLESLVEKEITRSPHPDLKYLDKVLTVPKFEELVPSEDNQEWLFGSHDQLQKPRKMSSANETKEAPQRVWSEAVPLESTGVVALPYVVPF